MCVYVGGRSSKISAVTGLGLIYILCSVRRQKHNSEIKFCFFFRPILHFDLTPVDLGLKKSVNPVALTTRAMNAECVLFRETANINIINFNIYTSKPFYCLRYM